VYECEPAIAVEQRVHDLVGVWALRAVLAECVHGQRAAEHTRVVLHGLAGVTVEADVRIQSKNHRMLPARVGVSSRTVTGATDRQPSLRGQAVVPEAVNGRPLESHAR